VRFLDPWQPFDLRPIIQLSNGDRAVFRGILD
jgi:hypothetical protein